MRRFITSDKRNTLNNKYEEKSIRKTICAGVRERLDKERGNKIKKESVKQKKCMDTKTRLKYTQRDEESKCTEIEMRSQK